MGLRVAGDGDVFLIAGEVATRQRDDVAMVNRFLAHLKGRNFARATRRAYAYDVLNFLRFLAGQGVGLAEVRPTDLFDYLDWQTQPKRTAGSGTVSDNLVQKRPARCCDVVVGRPRVLNYRKQGRTFPTSAPTPVLIEYLFRDDHPREGAPSQAHPQVSIIAREELNMRIALLSYR